MLTLYYRNPLNGVRRVGVHRESWAIEKVDFPPLENGATPPDKTMIEACHAAMRDENGKAVPTDVLARHDLREGLRAAFRAVDPDVKMVPPSSAKSGAA
ncbi:MAG: hypothetical protein AB1431_03115 [Pseudomonadota bacterium]|tara:strand:- start:790 stop:1086 length:297 start_codon:yes stop_codon:yes gene_type:complete